MMGEGPAGSLSIYEIFFTSTLISFESYKNPRGNQTHPRFTDKKSEDEKT